MLCYNLAEMKYGHKAIERTQWLLQTNSVKGGMALAAATVRRLIVTFSHQEQIGVLYPQVPETLARGACLERFA